MTIKEFSSLCGCNAKTLRYYDSIDLLKPARVDPWTGYRHYHEAQALDYIRIKNLQEAGFAIREIKDLLSKSDDEVYAAITARIGEQEEKLRRMKAIQQSYLSETMKMQETINTYREAIRRLSMSCDPMEEFGLTAQAYEAIIEQTADYVEPALQAMQLMPIPVAEQLPDSCAVEWDNPLQAADNEAVWTCSGWEHIKDALAELPAPEGETILYIELKKDRLPNPALTGVVMALLVERNKNHAFSITCQAVQTQGDVNRLWLLKKRES